MLINYAKIATYRMALFDREDRIQDAIVYILEKGLQDREQAYIIKCMKNKILYDLRNEERMKIKKKCDFCEEDALYTEKYGLFDLLSSLKPRDALLVEAISNYSMAQVIEVLHCGSGWLRNKWLGLRRKLKNEMCEV